MDNPRLIHGNVIPIGIPWETSHGMRWDRHKLLWDGNGTDKYVPWTTLGLSMGMSFLWESHGKRPMGWDRHKLLWDGNGTDKYVPWTTLVIMLCAGSKLSLSFNEKTVIHFFLDKNSQTLLRKKLPNAWGHRFLQLSVGVSWRKSCFLWQGCSFASLKVANWESSLTLLEVRLKQCLS